jgi:ethanolamine ammonia-lyase small subunit
MQDIIPDPWQSLRQLTPARIGLGHAGISQPTRVQLDFQLAHARARDAVHDALDTTALAQALEPAWPGLHPPLVLHSAARDRNVYLQRPNLGRRLDSPSRERLLAFHGSDVQQGSCDLSIVVADGLSALAVARSAAPFLQALRLRLEASAWTLAPLVIVQQGRVAIGDEIGELLSAKIVVVLIGERPGLSSPDSMGLYITWAPRIGLTDERRNCISNVRPAGLGVDAAADKLHWLLGEARGRQLTGVQLKDETGAMDTPAAGAGRTFLL